MTRDASLHRDQSRRIAGVEYRNLNAAELIEHAVRRDEGALSDSGAFVVQTGAHTGRSPEDKYIVRHGSFADQIWWGSVNRPMAPEEFAVLHADVVEHLARADRYRLDLSIGAAPDFNLPILLISESAWSALFARNLFLPPRGNPVEDFSGWTILHAPFFEAVPARHGTMSEIAIAIDFEWQRIVICGTRYAGEIKKSVFTVMQGVLPPQGVATMHCSANEGVDGDVALFFGLSGTGKTTLSTDPARRLIGDDEHGWSGSGIFNFEGGCYAKTIGLSAESEPEIYAAARHFGSVLENVVLDPASRRPLFADDALTENTRAAYPLSFLNGAAGGLGSHPRKVIFLTADAFGVLPPLALLTRDQALYWYLTGYTSKLAGTERGVTTPSATFSPCFGAPFLPLPPMRYASLLGEKLDLHGSEVWLVNTGWAGGPYGVGERISLPVTRAIIDAVLDDSLDCSAVTVDPTFGFSVPQAVPSVPNALLRPRDNWPDVAAYDAAAAQLARDMGANFEQFSDVSAAVRAAGPRTE